jgi:threonine/homoserine/homoserine lactone efflux protein
VTPAQSIAEFTLAAGLLTLVPGLDTALVVRTSASEGAGRGMLAGAGICLGLLVWGAASSAGLGALLAALAAAYNVLRIAGAVYLIYLGAVMLWRARAGVHVPAGEPGSPAPDRRTNWFFRGLMTNLLNPKVGSFLHGISAAIRSARSIGHGLQRPARSHPRRRRPSVVLRAHAGHAVCHCLAAKHHATHRDRPRHRRGPDRLWREVAGGTAQLDLRAEGCSTVEPAEGADRICRSSAQPALAVQSQVWMTAF